MNYGNIMYFKVTTEKQSEYQDTKMSQKEGSTAATQRGNNKRSFQALQEIRSLRELKTYMPFQKNR